MFILRRLENVAYTAIARTCAFFFTQKVSDSSLEMNYMYCAEDLSAILTARICKTFKETRNRFRCSLAGRYDKPVLRTIPLGFIGMAESIPWYDSWAPETFTNSGSAKNSP